MKTKEVFSWNHFQLRECFKLYETPKVESPKSWYIKEENNLKIRKSNKSGDFSHRPIGWPNIVSVFLQVKVSYESFIINVFEAQIDISKIELAFSISSPFEWGLLEAFLGLIFNEEPVRISFEFPGKILVRVNLRWRDHLNLKRVGAVGAGRTVSGAIHWFSRLVVKFHCW